MSCPYELKHIRRLFSKLDIGDWDECWEYQGGCSSNGYGSIKIRPLGSRHTHRVTMEYWLGRPLATHEHVMHSCDNPPCCNPRHLSVGTHADNVADKMAKGRHIKGESHGQNVLTEDQVRLIRRRYAEGGVTQTELGNEYGVAQGHISSIVLRRTWRHI